MLPLHHPRRSGGPGCEARRALASRCASFAPLFVNVLKCICRGGFTPWCRVIQAARKSGSSALCVSTHLAKHCIANASGIPPDPPPSHLACKLPSTSPQPCLPSQGPAASLQAPSSRCLSCPPPAHPLPPPQSLRAQKSRETSGKNKSQTPPCHQLPSAYPCPCPQCQLGLSLLQGPAPHPTAPQKPLAATPTLEGMDVHVLGPGGSARLQGAALCSSNLVLPFGWGILTAFSLAQSPPLFQPLDFSIFVLSFLPHPHFARQRACGRTFRRRLSCTRAMRCCGA